MVCALTMGGGDSLVHTLASISAEFLLRGYRREATKTKGYILVCVRVQCVRRAHETCACVRKSEGAVWEITSNLLERERFTNKYD